MAHPRQTPLPTRRLLGRNLLGRALLARVVMASGIAWRPAAAQPAAHYPERPITLIVPYMAGAASDQAGRAIALDLSRRLNQPVVVRNVEGASGTIGAQQLLRARPDGYTLLLGNVSDLVLAPLLLKDAGYQPGDFTPIARLIGTHLMLAAHPAFPPTTADELVAYARARPGQVNLGFTGGASLQRVTALLLQRQAGITLHEVPYKGGAIMFNDLLAGRLDLVVSTLPGMLPYIRTGRLKALGVLAPERDPTAPDLPTTRESRHLQGIAGALWAGLVGPPGMPAPLVAKLNAIASEMQGSTAFRRVHADMGSVTFEPSTPADFGRLITSEAARLRALAAATKPD